MIDTGVPGRLAGGHPFGGSTRVHTIGGGTSCWIAATPNGMLEPVVGTSGRAVNVAGEDEQWRQLGRHLAQLRAAAGYTQLRLAPLLHYGRSTVANVEVGRQRVPRQFWLRCDDILATGGQLTAAFDQMQQAPTALSYTQGSPAAISEDWLVSRHGPAEKVNVIQRHRSLLSDAVRVVVLAAGHHDPPSGVSLARLRIAVARAHRCYQRAEYDRAAALVPELMTGTASLTAVGPPGDHRQVAAAACAAHLAVAKLALKLGDAELGWVAADRAHGRALDAGDAALRAVALFAVGCALMAVPGRDRDAADLVEVALERARKYPLRTPAEVSAVGALTLLAALIADRHNDGARTRSHSHAADGLADRLGGDRNDLWTGFGPTNVLIHRVGISARTDPHQAIALGERIDTTRLRPALLSRRSQVHLDLAVGLAQQAGGDASAVLHLLQVEHLAPQLVHVHPPVRALIARLLGRERRAATPGLRALADRAGLAA